MIELDVLGRLALRGGDGSDAGALLARPKRTALLAYLALGADGEPVRRDTLVGLFWPEADARRARHSLSQALYQLRRALGEDVIRSEGDERVRLDPGRFRCDALAFGRALHAGALREALELYRGDALPGFHLSGCPEWDRWLEACRGELRAGALEAARALAASEVAAGNAVGAVRWLRRAITWAPWDESLCAELIRLLGRVGDRTGVRIEHDAFALRLARDLDMEPSEGLAAALADALAAPEPIMEVPHGPPGDAAVAADGEDRAAAVATASAPELRPARPRRSRVPARWAVPAAGALALALALGLRTAAEPSSARPGTGIVVETFDVRGDPRYGYLGEGMALLLESRMRGVPAPSGLRLEGFLVEAGGRFSLEARAVDREGRSRAAATAGPVAEEGILELADEVARDLISELLPGSAAGFAAAVLATSSLAALGAYLEGEEAFRAGRFVEASGAFERATRADSTFALAHYRLSLTSLWADLPHVQPFDADRRALRWAGTLGDRDRRLVEAYGAWRRGAADEAEAAYRALLALDPDHAEAWFLLGETLFHYNPLRGRPLAEARAAFERAAALEPAAPWGVDWHLALVAATEGRTREFVRRARRLLAGESGPGPSPTLEVEALLAIAMKDGDALARLGPRLDAAHEVELFDIVWRAAVHLRALDESAAIARRLTDPRRLPEVRATGHEALVHLALARGDHDAAALELDALAAVNPSRRLTQEVRTFVATLPGATASRAELEALREEVARWAAEQPGYELDRARLSGLLSAALGDTAAVRTEAVRLEDAGQVGFAAGLRARIAAAAGRHEEALLLLQRHPVEVWLGWAASSAVNSRAADRRLRADLLRALGREGEAALWDRSFLEHALHDLPLAPMPR